MKSRGTVEHILHPPKDLTRQDFRRHPHSFPDPAERSNSSGAGMASQEASFLSNAAGNGPRISERRNDGQAEDHSAPAANQGKQASAGGRSKKRETDQNGQLSFHVNPNFGDEEVSDSDVLVNAHASHNAYHQHYPHDGQPV